MSSVSTVSTVQQMFSFIEDVQSELAIFIIGMICHFIFFRVLRAPPKNGKDPKFKPKKHVTRSVNPATGCQALKDALKQGDLKTALTKFEELDDLWCDQSSPSSARHMFIEQTVKLAAKKGALLDFVQLLAKMDILDTTLEYAIAFCAEQDDQTLLHKVQKVGASHGVQTSCAAYQALIRGASKHGTQEDAHDLLLQARAAGMADVSVYFTYLSILLNTNSNGKEIRQVFDTMRMDGMRPASTSFNKLITSPGPQSDAAKVWSLIDEMKAFGVKPDQFTCAGLMKSRIIGTTAGNLIKCMALLDELEGDLDDVLFNSVVDACVRLNRPDLLMPFLKKQKSADKPSPSRSAHTYASIIRACGSLGDLRGVWDTWEEMQRQRVAPISVTVGCVVEALCSNGDVEGAYQLIQDIGRDEKSARLVNAVMYGSVAKGFSHKKNFARVWEIYDEMVAKKLKFSVVTFNTLIDACARSLDLTRIPVLLRSMDEQGLKMSVQTYGAILKGYCQKNMLDEAFELFNDLSKQPGVEPDEIMFNVLLDGCARQGQYERGMNLFRKMEERGLPPTNYTLSVLVKLCNRCRKLDKSFELCEQISNKYNFRMNVHVYSNLIQACSFHREGNRAMVCLEDMLQAKVRPDSRVYKLLVRFFIECHSAKDVDGLMRAALGLNSPHPRLAKFSTAFLKASDGLSADLVTEFIEGLMSNCGDPQSAGTLLAELSRLPGQKVDPKLRLRLAARMSDL